MLQKMRIIGSASLLLVMAWMAYGDSWVLIPWDTTNPFTYKPFAIRWPATIRYQQVFSATPFVDVNTNDIYLSRFRFAATGTMDLPIALISLSTTQKPVDGLSTNFAENIGPDETVVFGYGECNISTAHGYDLPLQKPFRYNPALGNLLMDVRILESFHCDPLLPPFECPALYGQAKTNDYMSRIWSDDANALSATNRDTGGFTIGFFFSPIPSLRAYISTYSPNYITIEWPAYPTTFKLQQSTVGFGNNASWQTIPNAGTPLGDSLLYLIPRGNGQPVYYRLIWPGGP